MYGYFVRWHAPGLVFLRIHLGRFGSKSCYLPTILTLIDLLAHCASSLEHIEIEGRCRYPDRLEAVSGTTTVHLPRLEYIHLHITPHFVTPRYTEELLRRLTYPPDTLMRVNLRQDTYLPFDLDITQAVRTKYSRKWGAIRMHDDSTVSSQPETFRDCYLDLYPLTPELLLALEDNPCSFHRYVKPLVSFFITPNDDWGARSIIRGLGINPTDILCTSFAINSYIVAPLAVPALASHAQTVVVEGSNTASLHSMLSALSHPIVSLETPVPEPVQMPHLKHLYLLIHSEHGDSDEINLERLTTNVRRHNSWQGVHLHLDASLHLHSEDEHAENVVRAQLLEWFERVHWGSRFTGSFINKE